MMELSDITGIKFTYLVDGKLRVINAVSPYSGPDISFELVSVPRENGSVLKLKTFAGKEIEAVRLEISTVCRFQDEDKIFANGFQSWTDSREFELNEKIRKPGILARIVMKKYALEGYGDGLFYRTSGKRGVFQSHTYTYIRNGKTFRFAGSLSEKSGFTIFEADVRNSRIRIIKDCEGALWKGEMVPLKIFTTEGSEDEVFNSYFKALEVKTPRCSPVTGWTSWYNYYQNITEDIIMENLSAVSRYAPEFSIFQIDDGYQCFVGDWLDIDSGKFPRGMRVLADEIHKKNMKAGIWLAPFAAEKNSMLFNSKPGWILKNRNGKPVKAGANWSSFYALDFYNPEVRDYLRKVFSTVFNEWDYDLVKLDFLYAVSLIPQHGKSRGEVMCEAMEFLRECAGDKMILGCGVPLGPSFGLVDYCRIGCDVSLDWDDKFYMKFLLRERISTLNSIINAISRRHLDGRAFLNDPDVFLLREDNLELTDDQKNTLFTVNSIFGSLVFTSDNFNLYNDKQMKLLAELSGFSRKKEISVEVQNRLFYIINYTENGEEHHLAVNLGSRPVNYNNSTVRPFETRKV